MELLSYSFVLAFILSVGFNLYQTMVVVALKQEISDREATIDDLETTLGG